MSRFVFLLLPTLFGLLSCTSKAPSQSVDKGSASAKGERLNAPSQKTLTLNRDAMQASVPPLIWVDADGSHFLITLNMNADSTQTTGSKTMKLPKVEYQQTLDDFGLPRALTSFTTPEHGNFEKFLNENNLSIRDTGFEFGEIKCLRLASIIVGCIRRHGLVFSFWVLGTCSPQTLCP